MIAAIIYTSNTGSTERYAKMLGEKIGLPVQPLKKNTVSAGSEIIYMGWLMGGSVKGYKKAAKKYKISAICGVGISQIGSQISNIRKQDAISDSVPVFSLQGAFDINKLRGIYKVMMNMMSKAMEKQSSEKRDQTSEEDDMINMMLHGGDRVSEANLTEVVNWFFDKC